MNTLQIKDVLYRGGPCHKCKNCSVPEGEHCNDCEDCNCENDKHYADIEFDKSHDEMYMCMNENEVFMNIEFMRDMVKRFDEFKAKG